MGGDTPPTASNTNPPATTTIAGSDVGGLRWAINSPSPAPRHTATTGTNGPVACDISQTLGRHSTPPAKRGAGFGVRRAANHAIAPASRATEARPPALALDP